MSTASTRICHLASTSLSLPASRLLFELTLGGVCSTTCHSTCAPLGNAGRVKYNVGGNLAFCTMLLMLMDHREVKSDKCNQSPLSFKASINKYRVNRDQYKTSSPLLLKPPKPFLPVVLTALHSRSKCTSLSVEAISNLMQKWWHEDAGEKVTSRPWSTEATAGPTRQGWGQSGQQYTRASASEGSTFV